MAIRTTVDIPEPLHDQLRRRAESSGTSIRSLIVHAIQQVYANPEKKGLVTGPFVRLSGKPGPRFPVDETPHDLILP
jgi:hypothetical protein